MDLTYRTTAQNMDALLVLWTLFLMLTNVELSSAVCANIGAPLNGEVSKSLENNYGSVATFSCNTGYTLSGNSSRTCLASSLWSGSTTLCNIISCPNIGSPSHGSVTKTNTSYYGSEAEYRCYTGYVLSGSSKRTCQASGSWSGSTPSCNPKSCGGLTSPQYGRVTLTGTTYRSIATYTCNEGYEVDGSTSRTCGSDGRWTGDNTLCNITVCPNIGAPSNGIISKSAGNNYNSVATYSCNTGYQKSSGSTTRACLATKIWSGSEANCERITCTNIGEISNGQVSKSSGNYYGSVATFSCNTGYALSGSSSRTCGLSGWSWSNPSCNIILCPNIGAPSNGTISKSAGNNYNSVATYSCNTGYRLSSGSTTRTCLATKKWSGSEANCERTTCTNIGEISNGQVSKSSGNYYGSVATFSCNTGYALSRSSSRTCGLSGWSWSNPSCNIISCPTIGNPANGSIITSAMYQYGSVAVLSCNTGYTLTGSTRRTCQASKLWSGTTTLCSPKLCGDIPSPANGQVRLTGITYGHNASYTCDTGYEINGGSDRTCASDGQWTGNSTVCEIISCGILHPPNYGSVQVISYTYGSLALLSCDVGHTLSGSRSRKCNKNKKWSGNKTSCTVVSCDQLSPPTNGDISPEGITYGNVSIFSCNAGYALTGNVSRVCGHDGRWSGDNVTCVETTEDDKPQIVAVVGGVLGGGGLIAIIVIILILVRKYWGLRWSKRSTSVFFDFEMTQRQTEENENVYNVIEFDCKLDLACITILEEILGHGRFGEVKKGTVVIGRETCDAAIKMIDCEQNGTRFEYIKHEVQSLKRVGSHPNVVKLLGYCINEGTVYICKEFMESGDLLHYLRRSRENLRTGYPLPFLSETMMFGFAIDVIKGMVHISSSEVVHRDLAARNVLLDSTMTAKISNFGLSGEEEEYCNIRQATNHVRWMAPESILINLHTPESDIWSYGVLLWEIVTLGGMPFSGMDTGKLMKKLQFGYSIRKPVNCSQELYDVMSACWEYEPEERPAFENIQNKLEEMKSDPYEHIALVGKYGQCLEFPSVDI